MTRSVLRLAAYLASVLIAVPSAAADSAQRPDVPNVVVILADDLGYGDVGCYACPDIRTPAIDRLAEQGVRFTCYYANGPECTPTRTAFMTGRYQQRAGGLECAIGNGNVGRYDDAIRLAEQHELGLPPSENTVVGLLKQKGYAVAGYGKWHLGYEPKFSPIHHGFDHFFGPLGGGIDYYFHCEPDGSPMLYENGRPVEREGYITDLITDRALEFLGSRRGEKPFFLYLPYTAPHTPLQAPGEKPAAPRTDEDWNEGTRETYAAMVERLDRGIGRVLAAIDRNGLRETTLVIFASDNGGTKTGRNAPFSGHKGGVFEGGIRVPCIVRYPGMLRLGTTFDQPVMTVDLSMSIIRLAGASPPADRPMDGLDILQHVASGQPLPERPLFWRQRRGDRTWRAVRDGQLKYIAEHTGDKIAEYVFDLGDDPGETRNLLPDRADDAARLKAKLAAWEDAVRPTR